MLVVLGRAEADAADLAEVGDALAAMMDATREEPGCLSYSLAVEREGGPGEPAVISIAERWADMDSLKAHFGTAHMSAFNRRIGTKVRVTDVRLYRVAEELPFPSPGG